MKKYRSLGAPTAIVVMTLALVGCSSETAPDSASREGQQDSSKSASCTPPGFKPGSAEPNGETLPADAEPNTDGKATFGETARFEMQGAPVDITIQAPTETTGNPQFPLAEGEVVCMVAIHLVQHESDGPANIGLDASNFDAVTADGSTTGVATVDNNIEGEDVTVNEPTTGFVSFTVRPDQQHLESVTMDGFLGDFSATWQFE